MDALEPGDGFGKMRWNRHYPLLEYDDNFDFTEQLRKKVFGAGYINLGGETSTKKAISAEFEGYLNSKPVPANTNVLEFLKQNLYIYPIMSRLARKNLCITAASSTSERVFSTAGNIYSSRRTNLSISKVEMLVYMKENTKQLSKIQDIEWPGNEFRK